MIRKIFIFFCLIMALLLIPACNRNARIISPMEPMENIKVGDEFIIPIPIFDNKDDELKLKFTVVSPESLEVKIYDGRFTPKKPGEYTIKYEVQNNEDTIEEYIYKFKAVLKSPVIEGSQDIYIKLTQMHFDFLQGVTVTKIDGSKDIPKCNSSKVIFGKTGEYEISYEYEENKIKASVTKRVRIYDIPTLNLVSQRSYFYEQAQSIDLFEGVVAKDSLGKNIEVKITADSNFDKTKYGSYIITYLATDISGNTIEHKGTILINENKSKTPVINSLYNYEFSEKSLYINFNLKGGTIKSIENDGMNLLPGDYLVNGNTLQISVDYLKRLELGENKFLLRTNYGYKSFVVVLNDNTPPKIISEDIITWYAQVGITSKVPSVKIIENYKLVSLEITCKSPSGGSVKIQDGRFTPSEKGVYLFSYNARDTKSSAKEQRISLEAIPDMKELLDPVRSKQFMSQWTVSKNTGFDYTSAAIGGRNGCYKVTAPKQLNEINFINLAAGIDFAKYDFVALDFYNPTNSDIQIVTNYSVPLNTTLPKGKWTTLTISLDWMIKEAKLNPTDWGFYFAFMNKSEKTEYYISNLRFVKNSINQRCSMDGSWEFTNDMIAKSGFDIQVNTDKKYVNEGTGSYKIVTNTDETANFAISNGKKGSLSQYDYIYLDVFLAGELGTGIDLSTSGSRLFGRAQAGKWVTIKFDLNQIWWESQEIIPKTAKQNMVTWGVNWVQVKFANPKPGTTIYLDNLRYIKLNEKSIPQIAYLTEYLIGTGNMTLPVDLKGGLLTQLSYNSIALPLDKYTIVNGKLIIKKEYLNKIGVGYKVFTLKSSIGEKQFVIKVKAPTLSEGMIDPTNSEIYMTNWDISAGTGFDYIDNNVGGRLGCYKITATTQRNAFSYKPITGIDFTKYQYVALDFYNPTDATIQIQTLAGVPINISLPRNEWTTLTISMKWLLDSGYKPEDWGFIFSYTNNTNSAVELFISKLRLVKTAQVQRTTMDGSWEFTNEMIARSGFEIQVNLDTEFISEGTGSYRLITNNDATANFAIQNGIMGSFVNYDYIYLDVYLVGAIGTKLDLTTSGSRLFGSAEAGKWTTIKFDLNQLWYESPGIIPKTAKQNMINWGVTWIQVLFRNPGRGTTIYYDNLRYLTMEQVQALTT